MPPLANSRPATPPAPVAEGENELRRAVAEAVESESDPAVRAWCERLLAGDEPDRVSNLNTLPTISRSHRCDNSTR